MSAQLDLIEVKRVKALRRDLLHWFKEGRRHLPWRSVGASNFELICVEVLLQQTSAARVASIYRKFFTKYPNWESIDSAPIEKLTDEVSKLGLQNRRIERLKALAKLAVRCSGTFPVERKELEACSGIGQYLASAIRLFQHQIPEALIDLNFVRLLDRYLGYMCNSDYRYDERLQTASNLLINGGDAVATNWAVFDFASGICRAQDPKCGMCPASSRCRYSARVGGIVLD
ncbi:hypothetical protein [Halomonas denitrificans]|nr:hypothetical protein [Halomonas denitrificans]